MNSNDTRGRGRSHGGRRSSNRNRRDQRGSEPRERRESREPVAWPAAPKLSFWGKIFAFFTGRKAAAARTGQTSPRAPRNQETKPESRPEGRGERRAAPPVHVEVTSPKLYVGNLSYDATESDLHELFNGVGKVQNVEIVTNKATYRSKGFGFVTLMTVDEARRAVRELHDKPFMGRKLVVTGSKSEGPRS